MPTFGQPKPLYQKVIIRVLIVVGVIAVTGAIREFLSSERSQVEDVWSTWTAPERAMACWGRDGAETFGGVGLEGVPREVLNEKCPAGETQPLTANATIGEEAERKWLDEAKSMYQDSPLNPEEVGLTDADLPTLCSDVSAENMANSMDPEFMKMPWEGTAYKTSHEFNVQLSQLMLDSLCE